MTLRAFKPSDPEFADFQQFSRDLYAGDPFYIEKKEHLPDNSELWLAKSEDGIYARCATFTRSEHPDSLFLGWYESIESDAGSEMLRAVCDIARERGHTRVIGPMNGSTWHQYRLAVTSHRPFLGDVYHKSWYTEQFVTAGFTPIATYHSSLSEIKPASIVSDDSLRDFTMDRFEDELRTIHEISISSFESNLFYSPISYEEFAGMYAKLRTIVDPRLVKFAVDDSGKEIGFMFAVPDLFERPVRTIVMKTIAVHPEHRGKGLMSRLAEGVKATALELGYSRAIYALYESSNLSGKLADGGELIRTYHLYARAL